MVSHRQWTCDDSFFSKIFQIIDQFGQMDQMNCGVTLSQGINFVTVCVPGPLFSINQPLFIQKVKLSRFFKEVGLGYEFGLHRIQNLAIMRP
jgi:hypothetical protein